MLKTFAEAILYIQLQFWYGSHQRSWLFFSHEQSLFTVDIIYSCLFFSYQGFELKSAKRCSNWDKEFKITYWIVSIPACVYDCAEEEVGKPQPFCMALV
jgi:hypothetical protein